MRSRISRRLAALELVDDIHAGRHFADDGILAVEEVAVRKHDEELAVGRVRVAGARRTDDAALERHVGEFRRHVRIFGAAGAVAVLAVAGLRHEAFDDAMERHVVIEAIRG